MASQPRRQCPRPGCPNTKGSCPQHDRPAWQGSTRKQTLPPGWAATRVRVLRRDDWTCQHCGAPANHVDHIIEAADGGSDDDDNLQALCAPCHNTKTGRVAAWRRKGGAGWHEDGKPNPPRFAS